MPKSKSAAEREYEPGSSPETKKALVSSRTPAVRRIIAV